MVTLISMQTRYGRTCAPAYAPSDMRFSLSRPKDDDSQVIEALNRVGERLDRLIELAEDTNRLLRSKPSVGVAAVAGRAPKGGDGARPLGSARRRGRVLPRKGAGGSGKGRRGTARRKIGLHEAIEAVLREAGEPLAAADIAQRISDRRLFIPPRSGKPLTASQVNSRVSNRNYKGRFHRESGRITLAGD